MKRYFKPIDTNKKVDGKHSMGVQSITKRIRVEEDVNEVQTRLVDTPNLVTHLNEGVGIVPDLDERINVVPIIDERISHVPTINERTIATIELVLDEGQTSSKACEEDDDKDKYEADPGLRKQISEYHVNEREAVQRWYLLKGPCRPPKKHNYPQTLIGKKLRRFNASWFKNFNWLEYSIAKDEAFCLYCFLFKQDKGSQSGGDSFVKKGFKNWERASKLQKHVGGPNSVHMRSYLMGENFLKPRQHVETLLSRKSDKDRINYRFHLTTVTGCVRFLLRQGLAFRGHNESRNSKNQGDFLELLKLMADHNEAIKMCFDALAKNHKMTSHKIQKQIVNACAVETTNAILKDLGGAPFSILVDEARDVSVKEQIVVVLRYVDKRGCIIECFLGMVHVDDTSAICLKKAIEVIFSKHGLSISRLRGQGYDGASNMRGEFNGLKALIMKENGSAYYVHCFAHQLQLVLVAVVKKHDDVGSFFSIVSNVLNTIGASYKCQDTLRAANAATVIEALKSGAISSGKGLNQEIGPRRPCDTRWGSHYGTLLNLVRLFPSILSVLEYVSEDGINAEQRADARGLSESMQSFNFIFTMYMMRDILAISNDLSKALQRDDQDIVNAIDLVNVCKKRLQMLRDYGWEPLLNVASQLCAKHEVVVPNMEENFFRGKSLRMAKKFTNLHYYRYDFFYNCIDWQSQELGDRFNEINTELLLCMASLDPSDSFASFDKDKLVRFAEFYSKDFSSEDILELPNKLENYVVDARLSKKFEDVHGISGLAKRMVDTKKHLFHPEVYLLITLALTLPVATASAERAFSAMSIVKNRLRNRIGDGWMNDSLVTYIEKDVFNSISDEAIMQRFQLMGPHRGQL